MLLAKMITVGLVGHLAFAINFRANTMRVSELSASMWIYLATHFIGSIISFPYVLHILVLTLVLDLLIVYFLLVRSEILPKILCCR